MYKRRKRPLNPQASSTMLSSGLVVSSGPGSTVALSQASTASNTSRSESLSPLRGKVSMPSDISQMTTKAIGVVPPSFEKENLSADIDQSPSQRRRTSAKDVLQMLTSPSSSQSSPSPMKRQRIELPMRMSLNFMEEILHKAGFDLGDGSEPNVLRKDQSVFVREVSRALKNGNLNRNVEEFMRFLKKHIDKKPCFKTALSQTRTESGADVSHGEMQESLLRLLLTVDDLQPPLINLLLDKLAELILPDLDSKQPDDRIMWVRLILRSMRYLNKVVDPSNITKSLFDVIHSALDVMIQTEIVTSIPDITGDEQCEEVAQELIDLMKAEPKLSPSVITSLSNIGLEGDILYQVQMRLIRTLRNAPVDQIPAFVKFIINRIDNANIDEIINGLRSELVIAQIGEPASSQLATASNKSDVSSVLVLTFEGIRDAVLMSKKFSNAWLKNIAKLKPTKAQKPIDIVMLLIIYASSDQTKIKSVETVFKSKIKDGTFNEALVDETVEALGEILKTYFKELLKLLSLLLNVPDGIVSEFASYFLTECFMKMESLYCRAIILELLESARLPSNTKNVLELLHNLTDKFPAKVANYVALIMLLLDSLPDMKVLEARQLMDILCSVAWGDHNDSTLDMNSLQDEVIMIVQKLLRRGDSKVFRNGVVCGLMVIKHLTCKSDDESNVTPESEADLDSLIDGSRSEKALTFLELILTGSQADPEIHVLAFDQLAYVILNSCNMDKTFKKKVFDNMQTILQKYYIDAASDFSANDDGLDAKLQFCLDHNLDDPVVLNVYKAVVSESQPSDSHREHRCVALPALLRVIRTLVEPVDIDALLVCAVAMPCPTIYSKFHAQDPYIQKKALDCLFHACNWFRECINTFIYMVREGSSDMVIMRLRCVVYLQNLISRCLSQTTGYSPPSCNVDQSTRNSGLLDKIKKINPPRKKAKKNKDKDKDDNDEPPLGDSIAVDSDEEEENLVATEFSQFSRNLRELDFDVNLLLTLPLVMSPEPPKDGNFTPEFGPSELLLILEDLSAKLKFCYQKKQKFGFRKTSTVGFDNFLSTPPFSIIKNTTKLIGHITNHLHKIVEYLHNMISVHDSCYDAPGLFIQGSSEVKRCASLIFDVIDTFISWPDLQSDKYIKFLIRVLMKVADKPLGRIISPNYAVQQAVGYLKTITKCILDITSAVNLTNLITTISSLQEEDSEDFTEINSVNICENFLGRKWYDFKGIEEKGPKVNQQLGKLLESYFNQGGLSTISSTLKTLSEETKELGKDSYLKSFPMFQKSNLNIFIKTACKSLGIVAKKATEGRDHSEHLKVWEMTVSCLQDLVIVVKNEDGIVNLRQFLKGCVPVIKLFHSNGMPVCSILFKHETMTVHTIIKKLQVVTRYIQCVCNYSKVIKDRTLIQQLPIIRGVLEQILLSVKNIMLQNKCTDAFYVGTIKNKDHHGEVIPTQESFDETITTNNDDATEGETISAINSDDENEENNSESISDTY